jgi:P27 family predicted phage terminase small subunit
MPPRGRKPLPRSRLADGKTPPMPRSLFPEARGAWRQIVGALERVGTLSSSDALTIELAAVAVGRLRQARTELAREGLQVRSERGAIVHPAGRLEIAMMGQARQLLAEMGLTATARTRLDVGQVDPLVPFPEIGPSPRVAALRAADD